MNTLKRQYKTALNKPLAATVAPVVEAFEAGATALSSFVDLLAFFRTDVEIKGKDVAINRRALVNELLRALRNKNSGLTLLNPAEFPPHLIDPATQKPFLSPTLALLGELYILKAEADKMISNLKELPVKEAKLKELTEASAKNAATIKANNEAVTKLDESLKVMLARLKKLKPGSAKAKALQAKIDKANADKKELTDQTQKLTTANAQIATDIITVTARIQTLKTLTNNITASVEDLTALNQQFEAFVSDFVKVDAGTGTNPLTVFVKAESLDKAMESDESYWVEINVDKAGGNNRVRKNLIRFFTGPKVDHSGGIVVDYTLYNKTGTVIYSDKLALYHGYLEPKKIQQSPVITFGDTVKP
jgi:DNA repair ATPase RecN